MAVILRLGAAALFVATIVAGAASEAPVGTEKPSTGARTASVGYDIESKFIGISTPFHEINGVLSEVEKELNDYVVLGLKWLRIDFYWGYLTQRSGALRDYDWSDLDRIIDAARARDINVMGVLHGKGPGISEGYAGAGDVEHYVDFARDAVMQFKGRVKVWEIINEPNLSHSGTSVALSVYARMLKRSYEEIKQIDKAALVLYGGLSPVPTTRNGNISAVEHLEYIYSTIGKAYFDGLNFHPYAWPLLPADDKGWNGWQIMERGVRAVMIAHGDADKKIWITEMGAPTGGGRGAVSEAELDETVRQSAQRVLQHDWLGPLFWYSYQDRGGATDDTENWFGIRRPSGVPKSAYHLLHDYAAKTNAIENGRTNPFDGNVIHTVRESDDGRLIEGFEAGDRISLIECGRALRREGGASWRVLTPNVDWLSEQGDVGIYAVGADTNILLRTGTSGHQISVKLKGFDGSGLTPDDFILFVPPSI